MYLFQDWLIFMPAAVSSDNQHHYKSNEIRFETDDVTLSGWYVDREISKKNPLIIYYGGNAEEVSNNLWQMQQQLSNALLLINYRGYGDSEGVPSESNLFKDALFIVDHFTRQHNIDLKNVIIMGRSIGSGVAVYVAHNRSVQGVILVTPLDSLIQVASHYYPIVPVKWLLKHPFDAVSLAPEIQVPVLIIIGDDDRIIANQHSLKMVDAWGGEVHVKRILDAGHNDISNYKEYWHSINEFIGL